MTTDPRLVVELVPRTSWFSNVRSEVSAAEWDRIRRDVYRRAGHRCELCGGRGSEHPVECHEVWAYDDERHEQRLDRMIALCPACHEVKHIGLASARGRTDVALTHLAVVNGWTMPEAIAHVVAAKQRWEQRSAYEWVLDLSALSEHGVDVDALVSAPRAGTGQSEVE